MNRTYDAKAIAGLTLQKSFAEKWKTLDSSPHTTIEILPSIENALEHTRKLGKDRGESGNLNEIHAFITGSIHLVGRALGSLEGVDAV